MIHMNLNIIEPRCSPWYITFLKLRLQPQRKSSDVNVWLHHSFETAFLGLFHSLWIDFPPKQDIFNGCHLPYCVRLLLTDLADCFALPVWSRKPKVCNTVDVVNVAWAQGCTQNRSNTEPRKGRIKWRKLFFFLARARVNHRPPVSTKCFRVLRFFSERASSIFFAATGNLPFPPTHRLVSLSAAFSPIPQSFKPLATLIFLFPGFVFKSVWISDLDIFDFLPCARHFPAFTRRYLINEPSQVVFLFVVCPPPPTDWRPTSRGYSQVALQGFA